LNPQLSSKANKMEAVKNLIWGDHSQNNPTTTNDTSTAETESKLSEMDINKGNNETAGTEPVSGELGNVEEGEPYDRGNLDSTTTDLTSKSTEPTPSTESTTNIDSTTAGIKEPASTPAATPSTTTPNNPAPPTTDPTSTTATHTRDAAESGKPTSAATETSPPTSSSKEESAIPGGKNQGADVPEHSPSEEGEHGDAIKETKKEAEEAQAVDVSGPSPKSLEEIAKESGGVAGSKEGESGDKGDGDDDGPQKESKGEGTGQKYVKSSGMVADGGDFDAANPGAVREAGRLLKEKGIQHSVPGEKQGDESEGSGKEKKSLKTKIKDKLHIHGKE
jgi:hypothetical protein